MVSLQTGQPGGRGEGFCRVHSLAGGEEAGLLTAWRDLVSDTPSYLQREAAERQAEVERRHLEARLSYEEAIIARESHLRDIHQRTQAMKEEVPHTAIPPFLILPCFQSRSLRV